MLTLGATDLEYLVLMTVLLLLPTVLLAMLMLTLGATDLEYLVLMTVGPVLEGERLNPLMKGVAETSSFGGCWGRISFANQNQRGAECREALVGVGRH